ncbi:SixA phosphatase family protein, partial [Sphingomonas solaris]
MKKLTLLRHAKSGWDEPVARDFDRPLSDRGRQGARRMGRYMREEGLEYDHLVASPAVRVVDTLDELWEGYGRSISAVLDRRIYLASCVTLLDVIHDAPDSAGHILLSGHNPGMEDMILMLVPDVGDPLRDSVEEKYPTAALAEMEFDIDRWADMKPRTGRLTRFVRPRDLD